MRLVDRKLCLLAVLLLAASGCFLRKEAYFSDDDFDVYYEQATQIEYADVESTLDNCQFALAPYTIRTGPPKEYWNVPLEEVVQLALANSKVLRDLGGTVLRSPGGVQTTFGPALAETDPQFGVEAALSAFDAQLGASLFYDDNDRRVNNAFLGTGGFIDQELGVFDINISKRTPNGSQFTVRHNVDYERDNQLGNTFPDGAWTASLEAEARQRLLQGRGLLFNRIAGPDAVPGVYNGVLVARVRTDISLADFEIGVRNFVSNVENAYWDLYFSYRDLNAKIAARDAALETWRRIHALFVAGRKGGEAENEAQAREQYFRFEEEVQNALTGRLLEPTRTFNGSAGGTFRASGGVHVAERRLRLLMGLPVNDGRLIRPDEEPIMANVVFDWHQVANESLTRRSELRRQQWEVKRRELEMIASRNFLMPSLDVVGLYRWRGFGDDLLNPTRQPARFDNAFQDLTTGDFQEWQAGVELSVPIGFRQAHAGVRNAEFHFSRAKAVLYEQERQVVHNAANALSDVDRAFVVMQTSFDRSTAAQQRLDAMLAAYKDNITPEQLFLILDAQRRLAEAQSAFYRTQVEYAVAIKNLHFAKGTLLEYNGVMLAEGPWPAKAHYDAWRRDALRGRPRRMDYRFSNPPLVGQQAICEPVIEPEFVATSPVSTSPVSTASAPTPPVPTASVSTSPVPRPSIPTPPVPTLFGAGSDSQVPNELGAVVQPPAPAALTAGPERQIRPATAEIPPQNPAGITIGVVPRGPAALVPPMPTEIGGGNRQLGPVVNRP